MQVTIPWNDQFPQYQIRAVFPGGEAVVTADTSHRLLHLPLPDGVDEDDVEITGCPIGNHGQPVVGRGEVLIKPATPAPQPAKESLPEPPVEVVEIAESSPPEHEVAQGRTPTPPVAADPREPLIATS